MHSRICSESTIRRRPSTNTSFTAAKPYDAARSNDAQARTASWVENTVGMAHADGAEESTDIEDIDYARRNRFEIVRAWGERRSRQMANKVEQTGCPASADARRAMRRFLKRFQKPTASSEPMATTERKARPGPLADYLDLRTFNVAEREAFDLSRLRAPPSIVPQPPCPATFGWETDLFSSNAHDGDIVAARALALDALRAEHDDIALPETLTRCATGLLGRENFFVMYRVDIRPAEVLLRTGFGRSRCFLGVDPMLYSGDPTRGAKEAGQDGAYDPLIGSASLRGARYVFTRGIVNVTGHDIPRLYAIRADGIRGASNAENFCYLDRAIDHYSGDALREMDEMHLDAEPVTSAHIHLLDCEDPAERRLIATLLHKLPYDVFGVPLRDFVAFEALAKRHGHPIIDTYDFPEAEAFFKARWLPVPCNDASLRRVAWPHDGLDQGGTGDHPQ
ncbi:hypothetical protein [Robbsia andropogonis]|uniref:hypothetical protein n=1 Tax=Robbsia andropogonis TaxID=28092 RepID=UPI000A5BB667|nr:hypothetical protein [Robbsia andropogonis]MCP1118371.1 hypothetical protein [Robbsia andropogonis]MCP1127850.1 hypothetical protein [Robbsia andropogonis]